MAEDPASPPSGDVHQVENLEVPRVHLLHVGLVVLQHGVQAELLLALQRRGGELQANVPMRFVLSPDGEIKRTSDS